MRVFLTGASGYLGGVLAEHLARMPEIESVTAVDLAPPKFQPPQKLKFVAMDVRSATLTSAMAGHDAVIHTAGIVLWPARMPAKERDDINLNGVRNVAQAALANKVSRFIHTSSIAAYDPHLLRGKSDVTEDFPLGGDDAYLYYWSAKAAAERILADVLGRSLVRLTRLRPIYIIGPRNEATVKILREGAVNFPGQDPRRQYIHEDDAAAAFIQALRTDMPGAYNLAPDDFIRQSEVWKVIGAKGVRTIPFWVARLFTWIRWRFRGAAMHPSWVTDMLIDATASNAKLKRAGWEPRHTSAQALRTAFPHQGQGGVR